MKEEILPVFEVDALNAGKRCGLQWCHGMGDWFVSWSPRNGNSNAEGPWNHWANLAAMILSHPLTKKSAPHLYRPGLKPKKKMYTENPNPLNHSDIFGFFNEHIQ